MKSPLYLVAALAIAASAACAPTASTQTASAAAPADRDCFNTNFVSGFSAVDKDTVKLEAGPRKDYEVDITGPGCDNVTWTMSVAVVSRPSAWICTGQQAGQGDIRFRDSSWPAPISCMITAVRRAPEPPSATPPT